MIVISQINLLICLLNDLMDMKLLENDQFVAKREDFAVKEIFQFILSMFAQ